MDTVNDKKKDEIYHILKHFLAEVIGEDTVEALDISRASVFTKDMEMDSIEIVSFAEKVKSKYGDKIDFIGWLSGMNMMDLYNLSLGQVVDFIADASHSDK